VYTASLVVYVVYPEDDDSVRECDEKFIMSTGADWMTVKPTSVMMYILCILQV